MQARLKVDNDYGEWIESNDGTSAGTRLGPLLFITYVKDVPACISLQMIWSLRQWEMI